MNWRQVAGQSGEGFDPKFVVVSLAIMVTGMVVLFAVGFISRKNYREFKVGSPSEHLAEIPAAA